MAKLTPAQYQEKHARRLKAAVTDMQTGVQNVTVSPTAQAAKAADKMKARLVASVDSGKWAAGLNRVTLDQWKSAMINKGVNRVASGIDGASEKVIAFATQFLPYVDQGVQAISKMPNVTLEDSISRMTTFTRHMAKFQRK
jgi:hypothetical protein